VSEVRDFLYLDMEKITSLYSQLTGGLVHQFEASSHSQNDNKNLRNYDFKIFKHEAGGTAINSESLKETWVSHHDLFNRLEEELFNAGFAVDLSYDITPKDIEAGTAASIFQNTLCVKAEGWPVLEDYERIKRIASNFNDIAGIINQSIITTFKQSPEMDELEQQLKEKEQEIASIKDNKLRLQQSKQLKELKDALETMIEAKKVGAVDEWIIDGVKKWVATFLPGIFNLRLYPYESLPEFHILSNLKRECFLDKDIEAIHYLYGSKPTLKFGMLGIVTSVPTNDNNGFDPMSEFAGLAPEEGKERLVVENAFRSLFRGFDGFEDMIRTCRYPRIMVYPIAVYRAVKPNPSLHRTP
jgi:hypothetical protein